MDDEKGPRPNVWRTLFEIALAALLFILVVSIIGAYLTQGFGWYARFVDALARFWAAARLVVIVLVTAINIFVIGFMVTILRRFYALNEQSPLFLVPAGGKERRVAAVPLGKEVAEEWESVKKFASSDNASEWNMAILQADALLDNVLQHMGHEGNTVKERLDKVDPTQLPSIDRVLSAHRLRNMIAHDPIVRHTRETIAYALSSYEQGLTELGVLPKKEEPPAEISPGPDGSRPA